MHGRSVEDEIAVVGDLLDNGGEATFVRADLANAAAVERLIDEIVDAYGAVNVLVNNAAIQIRETITDATLEDWSLATDVNFRAYWLCVKHAV